MPVIAAVKHREVLIDVEMEELVGWECPLSKV